LALFGAVGRARAKPKPNTKLPREPAEAETEHESRTARGNAKDVVYGFGLGLRAH